MNTSTTSARIFSIRREISHLLGTRTGIALSTKVLLASAIFLAAFSVRSLHAVDLSPYMYTSAQPMAGLTEQYDARANSIVEGHGLLIPDNVNPNDTGLLSFAPGYSYLLALIYRYRGKNYYVVQLVQNLVNSLTPVVLFLLAGRLISWRVGFIAGLLAAVAHSIAFYSEVILPDALCALPILIAIYVLVEARLKRATGYLPYLTAGVGFGVSIWLRPNGLLLPVVAGLGLFAILGLRRSTLLRALILVTAAYGVVSPITIRNYIMYRSFVPVSINLGIVLWEGIGEASGTRFGAVKTDVEVGEQEAALNHNPAYLWWASPNGIERNRDRTRKSLSIIEHHPVWYSGVMLRRMYGMVNYGGAAPMVQTPAIAASPNTASLSPGRAVAGLRWPVKVLQRVIRETSLPLILIGAAATLFLSRIRWTLILTVPLYYLIFQSATHTEFRYALPMPYFLFIFAAASWALLPGALMRLRQRTRAGGAVSRI